MPLVLSKISFKDLKEKANHRNNKRVGATVAIERRRGEYEREGYTGTMFYFQTQNMNHAENELLECTSKGLCPRNVQGSSNAQHKEGYVYVIIQ